ncbi:MAG: hypothetical protein WCK34_11560 [Bacteroidota bacterium]
MEENKNGMDQPENSGNQHDCGCEDGNCKPKKSNLFRKIVFAVILLAAAGIITVKLISKPAPVAGKDTQCKPGSSCCDTTKTKTCDTTKGSSCCPKN